jgi:hypothetical protein
MVQGTFIMSTCFIVSVYIATRVLSDIHTFIQQQISQMGKWTFVPRDFVHRNPRMKQLTDSGVGTYFPGIRGRRLLFPVV